MKKKYIILIFAAVIGLYLIIADYQKVHALHKDKVECNAWAYLFIGSRLDEVLAKNNILTEGYLETVAQKQRDALKYWQTYLKIQTYETAVKEVKEFQSSCRYVRVKRMVTSFVGSPAIYKKDITHNDIKESGQGATKDKFAIVYFTDGEWFKLLPDEDGKWFGVKENDLIMVENAKYVEKRQIGSNFYYEAAEYDKYIPQYRP